MSKKKRPFVAEKWFCVKCGREYDLSGGRLIWKPASPKFKIGFEWREYVCEGCGTVIHIGGFISEEGKK